MEDSSTHNCAISRKLLCQVTTVQKAITISLSPSFLSLTLPLFLFSTLSNMVLGREKQLKSLLLTFVVPCAKQTRCQIVRAVRNLRRFDAPEVSGTSA